MNALQNNPVGLYSLFSNEDDARAIEDATKVAIKVVLNVFFTISNNKMQEYRRSVDEKNQEIEMLRIRMESAERELVALRQFKHSVEQYGLNSGDTHGRYSCHSTEKNGKQRVCGVPVSHDEEKEVLSEGPYQRTHPQEREATACSRGSPAVTDLNHEVPSDRTTSSISLQGQSGGQPECDKTLTTTKVKEEPPDFQSLYIKWEMSEESVGSVECEHYPGPPAVVPPFAPLSQDRVGDHLALGAQNISFALFEQPRDRVAASVSSQRRPLSNRERLQKFRERLRADPERYRAYREKERNRQRNRRRQLRDLPEHNQKLRREYWREASRRHRARKKNSESR
ncbi:hypothetical protein COCON_G00006760 [Conger conger]|uniref:Uncharacterized protein n=1 Tax=Conger conger TaxID=82655 RepID=A0A9Q1E1R2_CONCO|nr:hypothetical protein COCON_G00006760 [Conger conger]